MLQESSSVSHSGTGRSVVAQVYQQQQEIAAELRRIRTLAASQDAQAARYAAAVRQVDDALRELGDAENYM